MSDTFLLLLGGFESLLRPEVFLACLVGVVMGTFIGVLPGIGPTSAIAILLPAVYGMDPLVAMVTLAGIFYGGTYGGTITAVLLNIPGEATSVATAYDGYPMCKAGKAGIAIGMGAICSTIAATIGVILLTLIAMPLARFGLRFGPVEYTSIYIFAFAMVSSMTGKNIFKALMSLSFGLLLATIGQDVMYGIPRLTFGQLRLIDGIRFVPAIVGLYGMSEILFNTIHKVDLSGKEMPDNKLDFKNVFPRWHHIAECKWTILRSTIVGFLVGVMPGAGGTIAGFLGYDIEKLLSKHPEKYGTGVIQGVAAPESANSASSAGALVPLLSLGIPGSGTTAVMLGAFVLLGVRPGPRFFTTQPELAWGIIASMYLGNVLLLILNTTLIPFFVTLLRVSHKAISIVVPTLCFIGIYSVHRSMTDVWVMMVFALVGYVFKLRGIPGAPLVLALLLGGSMEFSLRQSLVLSAGSPFVFFSKPISLLFVIASILVVVMAFVRTLKSRKSRT